MKGGARRKIFRQGLASFSFLVKYKLMTKTFPGGPRFLVLVPVLRTVPGILLMFFLAFLARGGKDLGLAWWPGLEGLFAAHPVAKGLLIDIFHFNYVLLTIILGMAVEQPAKLIAGNG